MKKTIALLVLAMGVLAAVTASAQPQPVVIGLQDAIDIALDENPTIKIAELEIERQTYVRKETIGNHLPQLAVNGSYSRAIVKTELGGGISFDPDNTVTATANLTIPLFAPGVYQTLKLNDQQMRAAVEAARGSKITLSNEVKKAYYNVLLAKESLDVLRTSEQTTAETVQETKLKYDNGLASEYDYITASVQLSNLQPTILQTEKSIEVGKKMLKMYLGLPLDMDIELRGDLDSYSESPQFALLRTDDIDANTDLRSMDIQIEILKRQLKVSRTQRMPSIAGFGNFSLTGRDKIDLGGLAGGMGAAGTGAVGGSSSSFEWMNPISAGVQISIPIFAGRTNTFREKQLKNNISQLNYQRDYLQESIYVQLDNARNSVITAESTMKANEITISQAQKGYDISRTRYNAGMGTMLEVNSSELALTQAKLNYTQAVYDYLSALADFEMIIGRE